MSEQAKLAAIIRLIIGTIGQSHNQRLASDIADAIIDTGQWVPRSALNAATARLDAVLAVHQRDRQHAAYCECGFPYPCVTVKAVAQMPPGGDQ